jgi:hypothetical protein
MKRVKSDHALAIVTDQCYMEIQTLLTSHDIAAQHSSSDDNESGGPITGLVVAPQYCRDQLRVGAYPISCFPQPTTAAQKMKKVTKEKRGVKSKSR